MKVMATVRAAAARHTMELVREECGRAVHAAVTHVLREYKRGHVRKAAAVGRLRHILWPWPIAVHALNMFMLRYDTV